MEDFNTAIKDLAKAFFMHNKSIIEKVFFSSLSVNNLHYSIVLKDDNIDSRNSIFEFLNSYDLLVVADKYPIYFQIIPAELAHKINSEELTLLDLFSSPFITKGLIKQ